MKAIVLILFIPLILLAQIPPLERSRARNSYLLDDEFSDVKAAGAVNGTFAVPGPGLRTVTDTESKLTISGGNLVFAGGKAAPAYGDPGLWYAQLVRVTGNTMLAGIYVSDNGNNNFYFGYDENTSGGINYNSIWIGGSPTLILYYRDTSSPRIQTLAFNTTYKFGISLKSSGSYLFIKGGTFNEWTHLWLGSGGNASPIYPAMPVYNSVNNFNFLRIPTALLTVRPLAYSAFTGTDGTALTQSDATSADGYGINPIAWNNSAWYITNNCATVELVLGSDVVTNGDFTLTNGWVIPADWNVTGGVAIHTSGTALTLYQSGKLTAGIWYASTYDIINRTNGFVSAYYGNLTGYANTASGSYKDRQRAGSTVLGFVPGTTFDGGVDNVSFKALSLTNLINLQSLSTPVVLSSINMTNTSGTQAGLVLRADYAVSPTNAIFVYYDTTAVKVDIYTNSVWFNVATVTTTYSAGARLVTRIYDDHKLWVWYNEALVTGAPFDLSSYATLKTGTNHGLFNTSSANRLDNWNCYPKNDATVVSYLNEYSGDNP